MTQFDSAASNSEIALDTVRSQGLGKTVASKPGQPFDNAHAAAIALSTELAAQPNQETVAPQLWYVQGFLVVPGEPFKPIEHAWLELTTAEQTIRIDPSFRNLKKPAGDLTYFPAHRLSVGDLQAAIEEAKEDYPEDPPLPIYGRMPYEYYGDLMLGDRPYQVAYEAAQAHCRSLNRPGKPVLKKP